MSRISLPLVLPAVLIALSGCGTLGNLSIGARQGWNNALIYGGVRRDAQSAVDFVSNNWTSNEQFDLAQNTGTIVGVGLVALDVPFSAIGDTLTLPITIPAALLTRPRAGANANGNSAAAPAPSPPPPSPPVPPPSAPPAPAIPPPPSPPPTNLSPSTPLPDGSLPVRK